MWNQMRPVQRLPNGAGIGLFSPSEPITPKRAPRFEAGLGILRANGFRPILGRNCAKATVFTAGSIEDRIEDLYQLAENRDVTALLGTWGGKSCSQLIAHLDYRRLAAGRKAVLGFSDVCVLLNALTAHTGLVTFYGPNVVGKLDETEHADLGLLLREPPANLLGKSADANATVLCGGVGKGRLFGGNLSTFVLGVLTAELPRSWWNGGIFFWEETGQPTQIVDQYLSALESSGVLRSLGGMVVGMCAADEPAEWKRVDTLDYLRKRLSPFGFPVLHCPTFGHARVENPILPIGALCELNTSQSSLSLLEQVWS
jgi:muramoyltetrapeptide carboxypeptidase